LATTAPAEEVEFSPRTGCNSARFLTKNLVIDESSFKAESRPVKAEGSEPAAKVVTTTKDLNEQINLKLYFDLANAVIAAGPYSEGTMDISDSDFCKGSGTRVLPYVCLNFPEIVGTIDTGEPSLTRLLINDSTIWGFYSDSKGIPFGAYQRAYYNGVYTTANEPQFLVGSMFERFQVNDDKSVSFQQYNDGGNRNIKVKNFKLEDHSGTLAIGSNATIPYKAVKLP
jgi:hypothetical protein